MLADQGPDGSEAWQLASPRTGDKLLDPQTAKYCESKSGLFADSIKRSRCPTVGITRSY